MSNKKPIGLSQEEELIWQLTEAVKNSGGGGSFDPTVDNIGDIAPVNTPITNNITVNELANRTQGQIDAIKGVSITVAELQALVTANNLAPSTLYRITNSAMGGLIYVRAISSNAIDNKAMWVRDTDLRAFGAIGLVSGTSGSVNSLSVDGVNQMTGVVNYTTSLANTAQLVCNNINANVSATWRAVRCDTQIVLESKTAGVAFNGLTVAGTSTTLVLGSTFTTKYGYSPSIINLNVTYNITTDSLLRCSDNRNNIIECVDNTANGIYNNFRWGDPRSQQNNYISNVNHKDVFLYHDGGSYETNVFNYSYASNVFIAGTGASTTFGALNFSNLSAITNVCLIATSGSAFISYTTGANYCRFRNITKRSSSANVGITGSSISSYGFIYENVNWNAGACTLSALSVTGYFCAISNITGTSTGVLSLFGNKLFGAGAKITNITCTGTGTYQFYRNSLEAYNSEISQLTFGNTGTCGIYYSTISGQQSKINSIQFNEPNSTLNNINISAPNATIGGFNTDSTMPTISNVNWAVSSYAIEYTTPVLNNTANKGQINSPITLGYIPAKFFGDKCFVEGSGLTSSTNAAQLQIGIETDNDSAFLPATVITSINSTVVSGTVTRTKATAVRKIVATPTVEGLTAGTFRLVLQGGIGL